MRFKKLLPTGALILTALAVGTYVQADTGNSVQKVIDETYVQPDYVLGYSLSEEQRNQTLTTLGYDASKDTQVKTLDTSHYAKIMNVADDSSLQLYSSVKIQKLGNKDTLTVAIATPSNITKVTQDMYRNAAVTLGIQHAKITVAAPLAVTGESALAGIYYSLEENGAQISTESKQLAQEELKTLSDINAENQGKTGYDADKLNVALTDIKTAVADGGSKLSKADVQQIVDKTLTNYQLKSAMTTNQITLIVNFAYNLSQSKVIDNAGFKDSLNRLKDNIVSKAKSSFKDVNLNFDASKASETAKGIWQQIVDFFTNLFS